MSEETMHIAIIPDGNRRWAKANKLKPWKGHEKSARNFKGFVEWCGKDSRVGVLTIWCFSTENWKRDEKEVQKLMDMLSTYLTKERPAFQKNKIRVLHSGCRDRLTPELLTLLDDIQEETSDYDSLTLHLAVDYGGKDELLRAIQKIEDSSAVTEEVIQSHLDQPDLCDIDLIIRTSGENRTSNFFLWQSTYSEWIFHPKLFPDFSVEDLQICVDEYCKRARRFGA